MQRMMAVGVLLLSAAAASAQTPTPSARQPLPGEEAPSQRTAFDSALTGTWRSAPDEMRLTSDFDKLVWGDNATSVRTVELAVRASGDATLKVTKKVTDAKGRTVPASTWVEEAQLKIGGSSPGVGPRIEHEVTVASAVRLFPDDKDYRWNIDGLRVKVVTFSDGDGALEVRYDTPDGRGSFWETLRRDKASAQKRTAR
jgi:hypothetical protein